MSRIGKQPVKVPSGVKVNIAGQDVSVEGPKGKQSYRLPDGLSVSVDSSHLTVVPVIDLDKVKASFGSARAHLNNMIQGVSSGWKKNLELVGVGFVAKLQGNTLVLSCGFSHDVHLPIPSDVKCTVGKNTVEMESPDRHSVGQFAAKVRAVQPPEPYLGKGIKYSNEVVRRKAGKTGKK